VDKNLPEIPFEVDKISYLDGCKIYFKNGGWIITRFSGTEPLLRIFCEMPKASDAVILCEIYEDFLGLNPQNRNDIREYALK
jgi:phosphomannomutase